MTRILGLKIDVDTYQGMKHGVPRLLSLLEREGIRATFFLSIGPDSSGRAMIQILRNPAFLKKMIRTHAGSLYGFRTALYGTLLPSPKIALSFPELVVRLLREGHEVQFHAWDHRRWQDELFRQPEQWIREWFRRGLEGFEILTDKRPTSFAAPGWLIDDRVISLVSEMGLDYLSCTRATEPFVHEGTNLMEIPSDLPCLEETGVGDGERRIIADLEAGGIHVLPVHAEMEGGIGAEAFVRLIQAVRKSGYTFLLLDEIRKILEQRELVSRRFEMKLLPGRAVPCAA